MSHFILSDIGRPNLDLLICGYNPGARSAGEGHYFSNKGNRFWWILAETGLTPKMLEPSLDHTLPCYGIGLTDLLKQSIHGSCTGPTESDRERLRGVISDWNPALVAFLGKNPARGFLKRRRLPGGCLMENVGQSELFMVPDPSGGNGHFGILRVHWDELARRVRSSRENRVGIKAGQSGDERDRGTRPT